MNELEEVEGTNKKISKQQGSQSSNSKQQVEQQASDLELLSVIKVTVYSLLMNYSYQIFWGFGLKI